MKAVAHGHGGAEVLTGTRGRRGSGGRGGEVRTVTRDCSGRGSGVTHVVGAVGAEAVIVARCGTGALTGLQGVANRVAKAPGRGSRGGEVRTMARCSGGRGGRVIRCGRSGSGESGRCGSGEVRAKRADRAAERCELGCVDAMAVAVVMGRCGPWCAAAVDVAAAVARCGPGCASPLTMEAVADG